MSFLVSIIIFFCGFCLGMMRVKESMIEQLEELKKSRREVFFKLMAIDDIKWKIYDLCQIILEDETIENENLVYVSETLAKRLERFNEEVTALESETQNPKI